MCSVIPKLDDLVEDAKAKFYRDYGLKADIVAYSPGRVCLLGDNTDLYDGWTLLMAIPLQTVIVGTRTKNEEYHLYSTTAPANQIKKAAIYKPILKSNPHWSNYPKGLILEFTRKMDPVPGFSATIVSSLPIKCGLGSSAALQLCTHELLDVVTWKKNQETPEPLEKASTCYKVETQYANRICSKTEQMCCALAEKNKLLAINNADNTIHHVPFEDLSIGFLLIYSGAKARMDKNEYATRRLDIKKALEYLRTDSFDDVTVEQVESLATKFMTEPEIEKVIKRARFIVTERRRAKAALIYLKERNYTKFGAVLNESQNSLRDDYETTSDEIDHVVNVVKTIPGVYGCRMTGKGFGGFVVAMIQSKILKKLITTTTKAIPEKTLKFYYCKPYSCCGHFESLEERQSYKNYPASRSSKGKMASRPKISTISEKERNRNFY